MSEQKNDPLDAITTTTQGDVNAAYEIERAGIDGANRSVYRRTRHAYQGAAARISDMTEETHSFWATISSLLDVDFHAARLEALPFIAALQERGVLPQMSAEQAWALSSQMLVFGAQTIYSGFLKDGVYTEEWLEEYERAKSEARVEPGGGPAAASDDVF
jgi:hypothetical protein